MKQKIKGWQLIFIISVVINLTTIIFVLTIRQKLPPVVPLFYGLPTSEETLAKTPMLIIPSIISMVFISINFLLIKLTKDKFLLKIMTGLTIAATALSIITTINIILLIGRI